ncbi:MAG: DUF397 domain-containing protein [Dactylosporangium sp.]|nr:DUF397 domain-containing protein [Dactylosporangium sp.]NNJ60929.1 DUF397 domain-containing protein [Dactylosporangium sp.]
MNTTPWIKATKSGGTGGNCVAARRHDGMIEVRDTKDVAGTGPTLRFTYAEWDAFLDGAKRTEFDHLTVE